MPRMPEYQSQEIAMSVGGSVLFPTEVIHSHSRFIQKFKSFLFDQLACKRSVIMVVGGGITARKRQEEARARGIIDPYELDKIGIEATHENVKNIQEDFSSGKKPLLTEEYTSQPELLTCVVYIRGGDEPGHTTDYVAVKAAIERGLNIVFNISNTPGVYSFQKDVGFDKDALLDDITYNYYLQHVTDHEPGKNTPFDRKAAELAEKHGITVVFLGTNLKNITNCLKGNPFTGTVMHR